MIPNPPPTRRRRRLLLWLAALPIALYVLVVGLLYFAQDTLVFPGSATQGRPEARLEPRPGTELVRLRTRDGTPIVGLFCPALLANGRPDPDAATRPTLLDFYGNGMYLVAAERGVDDFRRLGANVLIVEYPGYGMSGGRPSEAGCFAAADAFYDYLLTREDVDPTRIVALGWSLGGAVAIDLAARREVAGLIVLSTFTGAGDLARQSYPWVPIGLLLRHPFASLSKIERVRVPTFIGHGRRDEVVPHAMADQLARAAGGPVTRYSDPDADHGGIFRNRDRLLPAMGRFLGSL